MLLLPAHFSSSWPGEGTSPKFLCQGQILCAMAKPHLPSLTCTFPDDASLSLVLQLKMVCRFGRQISYLWASRGDWQGQGDGLETGADQRCRESHPVPPMSMLFHSSQHVPLGLGGKKNVKCRMWKFKDILYCLYLIFLQVSYPFHRILWFVKFQAVACMALFYISTVLQPSLIAQFVVYITMVFCLLLSQPCDLPWASMKKVESICSK